MKRKLLWFWLLTKRLYKKPAFLALLALIPLLLVLFGYVAGQDSGMVTVAFGWEGEDALARQVMAQLEEGTNLIRFVRCQTPEEAQDLVRYGKADAAWIFPADMQEKIDRFVESPDVANAIVKVVQREDSVMLRVTREKLSAALFTHCSRSLYLKFGRDNGVILPREEMLALYEAASPGTTLFEFSDDAGSIAAQKGYLALPVRGLVAVVITLCGLAAAMLEQQDRRLGTFAWVSLRRRGWVELGCQLVSVGNVTAVTFLGLLLTGLGGDWLREILIHLLYCLCVAGFAMAVRRLCPGEKTLAVLLPVLVVGMVGICPVFFDLPALRSVQLLLPPTYYIQALYNGNYIWYMVIFAGVTLGGSLLADRLRGR